MHQAESPCSLNLPVVRKLPAERFSRLDPGGDTTAFRYIVRIDEHPVSAKAEHRSACASSPASLPSEWSALFWNKYRHGRRDLVYR
jgi:hypothetical protein